MTGSFARRASEGGPERPSLARRARPTVDAARDDLLGDIYDRLGDPAGVRVVGPTGFLEKGTTSCGVARPYTGPAGRVGNAQAGVFLGYAGPKGYAPVDRALYRPKGWADDRDRCDAAG